MSDWWHTIAEPIVKAVWSLDVGEIKDAVRNAPHTYYQYIRNIYERSPEHVIVETLLICFVVYITFVKKGRSPKEKNQILIEREIDELCAEWTPEPLVVEKTQQEPQPPMQPLGVVLNTPDTHIQLAGVDQPLLNFALFDFLGFASRPVLKQVAKETLTKYGCGSCGPRGFYGSIDTHEFLEQNIAAFLGTPDAIIYSDSDSTASSVLPAFAKRGDLIVMDKGCYDPIHVGAYLSRCSTHYYKHNDLEDLERVLKSIRDADKKAGRGSDCQRRYIVTEALFRNYGDIIDLPAILALCEKYFFRLFLDESLSFGVLGKTGRGITEHYGVPISDVEIICASLSSAIAGVGGFSTGSQEVVDYQRINSAGYVFSASAPPFTSTLSSKSLELLKSEPQVLTNLRKNSKIMHEHLSKISTIHVISDPLSPILHITIRQIPDSIADDINFQVYEICRDNGLALVPCRYKEDQVCKPSPSLRLTVTAIHSKENIAQACSIVADAIDLALKGKKFEETHDESNSKSTKNSDLENFKTPLRRSMRNRKASTR